MYTYLPMPYGNCTPETVYNAIGLGNQRRLAVPSNIDNLPIYNTCMLKIWREISPVKTINYIYIYIIIKIIILSYKY